MILPAARSRILLLVILAVVLAGLALSLTAQQQASPPPDPAFKEQFEQGRQAWKAHKYKEAIDSFKKANKLHQNACGECYFFLALAYYDSKDFNHAVENCDKAVAALSSDPARALAHNLKGNAISATAATDRKKLISAETEFRSRLAVGT